MRWEKGRFAYKDYTSQKCRKKRKSRKKIFPVAFVMSLKKGLNKKAIFMPFFDLCFHLFF